MLTKKEMLELVDFNNPDLNHSKLLLTYNPPAFDSIKTKKAIENFNNKDIKRMNKLINCDSLMYVKKEHNPAYSRYKLKQRYLSKQTTDIPV